MGPILLVVLSMVVLVSSGLIYRKIVDGRVRADSDPAVRRRLGPHAVPQGTAPPPS